jgi:hypothetical protein
VARRRSATAVQRDGYSSRSPRSACARGTVVIEAPFRHIGAEQVRDHALHLDGASSARIVHRARRSNCSRWRPHRARTARRFVKRGSVRRGWASLRRYFKNFTTPSFFLLDLGPRRAAASAPEVQRPMSDAKSLCRTALLALVAGTALLLSTAGDARAGGCKPNNQVCSTNMSCCSRNCAKPIVKKATALFGLCCPAGARISNGACCTPATSCAAGACGTVSDGCGGTINCGGCDATQCLACASNACVSACTSEEVCDQGSCVTTTSTTTTSTTTTTTGSTTTTTLAVCGADGVLIACVCGDGMTPCTSAATFDCTGPTPDCSAHQAECVSDCGALGPGTCATTPCTDCDTNQPCQDASSTTTTTTATTTTTTLPCQPVVGGGCTGSCSSAGTFCAGQSNGELVGCMCINGATCAVGGTCFAIPTNPAEPCSATNLCPPPYLCDTNMGACFITGHCAPDCSCPSPGLCVVRPG